MFFPYGCEAEIRLPWNGESSSDCSPVHYVCANRDRNTIAAVTDDVLYLYLAQPQVLLCLLGRDAADVLEKGAFRRIYWRFDSSFLAVLTSRNHILIYRVETSNENCYNLIDSAHSQFQRQSQELFMKEPRPNTKLNLAVVVNLAAKATCAVSMREELLVSLTNGFAHRISWSGQVDAEYSIRLSSVPFANDQLQSRPEFIPEGTFIKDMVYAPLMGGYCVVLNDGRASLFTSSDPRFHPTTLLGVWALQLNDAACVDVNHKHRLLVFGCSNGDVAGYHIDDVSGALLSTFRVPLVVKDGPELLNWLGPVRRINVLQNGAAFAVIWGPKNKSPMKNESKTTTPALAIFSAYGGQTWCSLEASYSVPLPMGSLMSVEWGAEGLHLWIARSTGLSLLPIVHNASINNPTMEHSSRVLLIGSSKLLLSPAREREPLASAPHSVWTTLTPHNEYLANNWPIRFASIDREEARFLVIAGTHGFAHGNLATGKWKIFGNESQERELITTGGVFIWKGTVGVACCNVERAAELLRFYPLNTKLDNQYCSEYDTEARILALNIREDCLVTFDVESRILLFRLTASQSSKSADAYVRVAVEKAAEIRVGDLIPHPACLVSIHVTELIQDKPKNMHVPESSFFVRGVDTVLVNVSGRLITLNPKGHMPTDTDEDVKFQLSQPIVVASFVEHLWHDRAHGSTQKAGSAQHLSNAMWIYCGAKGMKVWLTLSRRGNIQQESFHARRNMLPFTLDIRPVIIYSSDCVAVGVESLPTVYGGNHSTTLYNVHRNSEVFLHHILKELLKKNLGEFAIEIASSCRHLPYFPHALELLLHGVLEEEATSSEPIPDPLLPRVVGFIKKFPENLRTMAHCARKTELALWPALFGVTGSPNDTFEMCLRDGELQTAASYLIVLQSIENTNTSLGQAARLLREALSAGEWSLAQDMIRFASSIDAEDIESQPRTPPPQLAKVASRRKGTTTSADDELFVTRFQAAITTKSSSRMRHDTQPTGATRKDSGGSGRRLSKALSSDLGPPSPNSANAMLTQMQAILKEHAANLLRDYCIRDLGFFCAHLNFDLVSLLTNSGVSTNVNDWSAAISRLHSQFEWPYPVAGHRVVDHLARKLGSMKTSQSSVSLATTPRTSHPAIPSSPIVPFSNKETQNLLPEDLISDTASTIVQDVPLRPTELAAMSNGRKGSSGEGSGERELRTPRIDDEGRTSSPTPSSITFPTPGTPNGAAQDISGIDLLCGWATVRGSDSSDAQLLHMINLFEQAQATDWVFLLALLRRDSSCLRNFVNVTTARTLPTTSLQRLKYGCDELMFWAKDMCTGYLPILQVFLAHIEVVADASGISISNNDMTTNRVDKEIKQNGVTASTNKKIVPRDPLKGMDSRGALRAAFDPTTANQERRRRERSRSVDRRIDTVNAQSNDNSDCVIM
ncbi:unnamed protein product, partial [Mesorhabditis belari]|uniref:Protein RIC1 homolog n=1 Tax=Mesorhabditis belari TaxID=2138241 RepID=A0AAF3EY10_9BILA